MYFSVGCSCICSIVSVFALVRQIDNLKSSYEKKKIKNGEKLKFQILI